MKYAGIIFDGIKSLIEEDFEYSPREMRRNIIRLCEEVGIDDTSVVPPTPPAAADTTMDRLGSLTEKGGGMFEVVGDGKLRWTLSKHAGEDNGYGIIGTGMINRRASRKDRLGIVMNRIPWILDEAKRKCAKYNIDFNYNFTDDDEHFIVDVEFADRNEHPINDHILIGSVIPIVAGANSGPVNTKSLFIPVLTGSSISGIDKSSIDEIAANLESIENNHPCDICKKRISRGTYFVFRRISDGRTILVGSNCAEKYLNFGFAKILTRMVYSILELMQDLIPRDDRPNYIDDEEGMGRFGSALSEFEEMMQNTLLAVAAFGNSISPKHQPELFQVYSVIHDYFMQRFKERSLEDTLLDHGLSHQQVSSVMDAYFDGKAREYADILKTKGPEWVNAVSRTDSSFDRSCKQALGLALSQWDSMPANALHKIIGIMKWAILAFFRWYDVRGAVESGNMKEFQPFEGRKQFNVKIDGVFPKTSRNGYNYNLIMATTDDGYSVSWCVGSDTKISQGATMTIAASFYGVRDGKGQLTNVEQIAGEGESVANKYPPNGTRFSGQVFVVKNLISDGRYAILNKDGLDYLFSNIYYRYDRRHMESYEDGLKFDFSIGDKIRLNGTVEYYRNRDGEERVKLSNIRNAELLR